MGKYIAKRVLRCVLVIIAAAALIFTILYFAPNDPAECILAKPVIYLYPAETTDVTVTLEGVDFMTTYPAYNGGWHVTAQPDGTITNLADGYEYSYLFWDGTSDFTPDFSEGFCVKGEDTAEFLRTTLSAMGLTAKEYNEFIVYWLPLMEGNEYNVISFQGENYDSTAKLTVSPEPDSVLRVFMAWYGTDEYTELKPQELSGFNRDGFTVVEWGGCKYTR